MIHECFSYKLLCIKRLPEAALIISIGCLLPTDPLYNFRVSECFIKRFTEWAECVLRKRKGRPRKAARVILWASSPEWFGAATAGLEPRFRGSLAN